MECSKGTGGAYPNFGKRRIQKKPKRSKVGKAVNNMRNSRQIDI